MEEAPDYIYHLLGEEEWEETKRKGKYEPESLETEGFIHFCEKDQIETVLQFEDQPKDELIALKVKTENVEDGLKYENNFPHLYRELKINEVEEFFFFKRNRSELMDKEIEESE